MLLFASLPLKTLLLSFLVRVNDIDKHLDMRLVLRLRQDTELFSATANFSKPLPVFIYENEGKMFMSTYFPKQTDRNDMSLLLRKFEADEKEDSFVTTTRINNVKDLAIIRKLLDLPSMTLNRADISSGFLNVYARFHSCNLDEVSHILSEYTSDRANSRVEWLGPSPGIIQIMDLINSQYPISLVTYEISDDDNSPHSLSKAGNVLVEVKGADSESEFSSILYADPWEMDRLPEGTTKISPDERVHSFTFSNRFLGMVRDRSNRAHIIRMRFFVKPLNGKLEVSTFLPTSQVYEYYSILYDVARLEKNSIVVKYLMPYSSDLWDFI